MTEEDRNILNQFETQLRIFIHQQQELKKENGILHHQLGEKENEILDLTKKNQALQEKYSRLKAAMTIEVAGENRRDTKLRLSKLVREIDKCIALLNE